MKRMRYQLIVLALLAVLSSAAMGSYVIGDVKVKGTDEFPPAIFPHWVHRVKFKCFVCHNDKVGFTMKANADPITMDAIEDGKYCGVCHKGNPAFAVGFETCSRCHRK
jgi:c(7)-type cytochrome triheme protein